jgi:hypothetical protein
VRRRGCRGAKDEEEGIQRKGGKRYAEGRKN